MSILSVNAGSSSLKFALYPIDGQRVGGFAGLRVALNQMELL